jgi:hypothetical protein
MKKSVVVVLAVIGALSLMCIGGIVFGGVWLSNNSGPPEGIAVQITRPDSVVSGEAFDVVITVTNSLPRARRIRDIDLWGTLVDGISVVSTDPVYKEADLSMGFWTYTMEHPIAANGTATVTLKLTAGAPGVYQGDLDVSVDKVLRVNTTDLVITVTPAQ